MLLSAILEQMTVQGSYDLYNEQEFDTLALTASRTKEQSCVFLDNAKYLKEIKDSAVMVLTKAALWKPLSDYYGNKKGICVVENPRELFFRIHNSLAKSNYYIRKNFPTEIGVNCTISHMASIAAENVIVGRNVTIEEFAVIRENTVIGDHTIIRAGAKIGGQGYEFKRTKEGMLSVEHLGGVKIGAYAEIQYNSCIDRAVYPWDDTVIGNHTKIDNLVHVGHGVKINDNVMLAAQSGIGGRTVIGGHSWIGFGATVSNGLNVENHARANIGSVVTKDIGEGKAVSGNFAIDHETFIHKLKEDAKIQGGGYLETDLLKHGHPRRAA